MAFDNVVIGIVVEYPVNRTEDLSLGNSPFSIHDEVFQDTSFPTREHKSLSLDLRIAAIGKNPNWSRRIGNIGC